MERHQRDALLADLHSKFELLLEDYTTLHSELQALRRETRERHELGIFLLGAIAADLAAHRSDSTAHDAAPPKTTGRPTTSRPARLAAWHAPG